MQERGKVQARNIGLEGWETGWTRAPRARPSLPLSLSRGLWGVQRRPSPSRPPSLGRKSLGDLLTWGQEGSGTPGP